MKDQYGREIDYLRVSLTERCNLRCRYCMPEGGCGKEEPLSLENLFRLCALAGKLGIRRFKVTGGEPLVREGCLPFLSGLKSLPGVEQVTLTTNGLLLGQNLAKLKECGVDGINVSLDSLDRDTYRRISGADALSRVLENIDACLKAGIRTKINCVPIRGINDHEIESLALLARERPLDVRFIELMPMGAGRDYEGVGAGECKALLEAAFGPGKKAKEPRGNGPAWYLRFEGFQGCVGFIDAVHEKFCGRCNRVRLTSKGVLKTCLFYQEGAELGRALLEGAKEEELLRLMEEAIFRKKKEHHFFCREWEKEQEQKGMSQIGG